MEDYKYLLICLVLIIAWLVYVFWSSMEEDVRAESELHARDRYSIAEKITKELKNK